MNDERHPGPMWMTVDGFTDTASGCFDRYDRCMMVMLLLMLVVVVVQLVLLQLLLLLLVLQLIIERPELVPT